VSPTWWLLRRSLLALLGPRLELSRPADSSIALEVVHQLTEWCFFFPFNLTFLTTWSELFTSNGTVGCKSLYPFQITSSKMPNGNTRGLKTDCVAVTSKLKNFFFMSR